MLALLFCMNSDFPFLSRLLTHTRKQTTWLSVALWGLLLPYLSYLTVTTHPATVSHQVPRAWVNIVPTTGTGKGHILSLRSPRPPLGPIHNESPFWSPCLRASGCAKLAVQLLCSGV